MERVHAFESRRAHFAGRIAFSRPFRYALACGGTFVGVFGAVPAF